MQNSANLLERRMPMNCKIESCLTETLKRLIQLLYLPVTGSRFILEKAVQPKNDYNTVKVEKYNLEYQNMCFLIKRQARDAINIEVNYLINIK